MMIARLLFLFPLVLTLALLHALPLLPRRSRLFGVDVPREVRYGSEGARLLRSYQLGLFPFSMAAFLAACWIPFTWLWAPVSLPAIAALWLLYRCHANAVRFALPPPSTREVSLRDDTGGLAHRLLWFAPPLVLVMAAALYLWANWSRIPQRFAIHFDAQGNPNGWAFKTVRGAFGPLAFGGLIILYLLALYVVMELGSRRGTQRPAMLVALAGLTYLVGAMFAMIALLPLLAPPLWAILLLVGGYLAGLVALILLIVRVVSRPAAEVPEVTPDRCWHGSFYYNPEDPALFVDGRMGFGLTANFARRAVWGLVVAIAVFTLGLILLAPKLLASAPPQSPEAHTKQVLDLFLAGQYDAVYELFTAEMKKAVPLDTYKAQAARIRSLGAPKVDEPRAEARTDATIVTITLHWPTVALDFAVRWNMAGQIEGTWFAPPPTLAWQRPDYSRPDSFTERQVTVGADAWKLPATLAVPKGSGPFPAVVLVHGSGPNDRDESLGGVKVFRDLAEGLASRGIAVLRYEKRTKVYPAQCAADPNFTMTEETVEDAVRAAALLGEEKEIDPRRVFVLGHSQGGYMMPRIAARAAKLAGVIVLAGNVRPLEELVAEQIRYLNSLQGRSEEAPANVLHLPAPYLLDLKGYNPAEEASKLDVPMLIMQGGRDYQVSMKDFALWKAALDGRKNVTLRAYPNLNHLFIAGEGKSTPAEYQLPGHVAAVAIDDIAKWIARPF
jgi:uncharacterized protein